MSMHDNDDDASASQQLSAAYRSSSSPFRWTMVMAFVILCGASTFVEMSPAREHFCGKKLDEVMAMICKDGFPTKIPLTQKRDGNVLDYALDDALVNVESTLYDPRSFAMSPFLATKYGNLMAKTRRRRQEGIYYECCRQSCSYQELLAYCR